MKQTQFSALLLVPILFLSAARAVTIETVAVGNPGNAGELSGSGAGGFGPDAIVGGGPVCVPHRQARGDQCPGRRACS